MQKTYNFLPSNLCENPFIYLIYKKITDVSIFRILPSQEPIYFLEVLL